MRSNSFPRPARLMQMGGGSTEPEAMTSVRLLPTPNASDASGGAMHPDRRKGHSRQLIDFVSEGSNAPPANTEGV